jgi:hypothetical protein
MISSELGALVVFHENNYGNYNSVGAHQRQTETLLNCFCHDNVINNKIKLKGVIDNKTNCLYLVFLLNLCSWMHKTTRGRGCSGFFGFMHKAIPSHLIALAL